MTKEATSQKGLQENNLVRVELSVPHVARAQPPPCGVAPQTVEVDHNAPRAACSAPEEPSSKGPLRSVG